MYYYSFYILIDSICHYFASQFMKDIGLQFSDILLVLSSLAVRITPASQNELENDPSPCVSWTRLCSLVGYFLISFFFSWYSLCVYVCPSENVAKSEEFLNIPAFCNFLVSPGVKGNLFKYNITLSFISKPFMRELERLSQFL